MVVGDLAGVSLGVQAFACAGIERLAQGAWRDFVWTPWRSHHFSQLDCVWTRGSELLYTGIVPIGGQDVGNGTPQFNHCCLPSELDDDGRKRFGVG